MDLSKLSDEDLQKLYEQGKAAPAATTAATPATSTTTPGARPDLTKLSDDELQALAAKTEAANQPFNFGRWAGTRATNAASSLLSIGRGMADTKRSIIVGIAKQLGVSDDTAEKIAMGINAIDPMTGMAQFAPTKEQISDFANKQTGLKPQNAPESWGVGGKMLDIGTEAALSSLAFPSGGVASVARNVVPAFVGGAASEGAGNIPGVKDTPWEMPVRTVAGLLAGTATGAGQNTAVRPRGAATPLSDTALQALGLTDKQVASMTPELRQAISDTARRTFGNREAVGSAYRGGLGTEFKTGLTRGEITGDPGQIAKEQTLAAPGAVPGSGYPRQTILDNRTVQNQQLTAAQEALRGGGQPPLNPEQAGTVLKQGAASAETQGANNVDQLYQTAKNPAAVAAAGGAPTVPASHAQGLGAAVRADLATTGPGRAVLDDPSLTPNAAKALARIDELGRSTALPQPTVSGLLGPDGRPLATATPLAPLSWEQIDNQRKMLLQYRDAAFGPNGTKTDQAAITQIIKNFDDHFGQLNPLLQDARAAHAEQMSTFKPGGSLDQDKATQTVLEQLQGPEGGTKVMNTILGGGLKKGEAEQMMDHLVTKVLPAQPEALQALKDQALRRLVVDAKGDPLSPQKASTALGNALDGDTEKGVYAKLFSPDELARLRRFKELQDTIAKSRTPINPPGSGTIILDYLKHAVGGGIGGTIGYKVGSMFGMPEAGATLGTAAGSIARTAAQRVQAARAINPPANYGTRQPFSGPGVAAGQVASMPGLLSANSPPPGQPGPVDHLWQSLLGP